MKIDHRPAGTPEGVRGGGHRNIERIASRAEASFKAPGPMLPLTQIPVQSSPDQKIRERDRVGGILRFFRGDAVQIERGGDLPPTQGKFLTGAPGAAPKRKGLDVTGVAGKDVALDHTAGTSVSGEPEAHRNISELEHGMTERIRHDSGQPRDSNVAGHMKEPHSGLAFKMLGFHRANYPFTPIWPVATINKILALAGPGTGTISAPTSATVVGVILRSSVLAYASFDQAAPANGPANGAVQDGLFIVNPGETVCYFAAGKKQIDFYLTGAGAFGAQFLTE